MPDELVWRYRAATVYQAPMFKLPFRRAKPPTGAAPLFQLDHLVRENRAANEAHIRHLCRSTYVGDHTTLSRVLGRYKMYLDTQDVGLSGHLMMDGYWEMWLSEALAQATRPGMICADVGANLGYFTVLMSAIAGANGHVHAFEPNPSIAERLARTLALNGFNASATLHQDALGAEDGDAAMLIVPKGEPKNAHVILSPMIEGMGAVAVTLRRLDTYPELQDLDLIKIDAEGAERKIWEGMSGILARGRPMTVFMEFTPARYDDAAAFLAEIACWGFSLSRLDLSNGLARCDAADVLSQPAREDQMLCFQR